MNAKVRDLMTPGPIGVDYYQSIGTAARTMRDWGVGAVLVVSDQAPTSNAAVGGAATGPNGHGVASLVQGTDDAIPAGFGLAVISGLADEVHVSSTSSGVSVRMSWPSATPVG